MSTFVGADRANLRDAILARIEEIAHDPSSTAPRIILLEGLSGVGKSRIIREVYNTLRQRTVSDHPQYWPPLDISDGDQATTTQSATVGLRKVLGPPTEGFLWDTRALPTFLWWAINCEQLSNGAFDDASRRLEEATRWHSPAILMGWRKLAPISKQAKSEMKRTARAIRGLLFGDRWDTTMGAAEVVEALTELELVTSSIPGLGMVVGSLKRLFGRLKEERHLNRSLAERITYGESPSDWEQRSRSLALGLRSMALPDMPAIVAVEDAHRMDEHLAHLVDQLTDPTQAEPLVVLCTAWPTLSPDTPFEDWKQRWLDRNRLEILHVGDLDPQSRLELVNDYVPGTDGQVKAALAHKWHNPLCLELFLSWDEVRARITETTAGPALSMTVTQVQSQPDSIEELYRARWAALHPDVKKALLTTAGCLPSGQPMHPFITDILTKVVSRNPLVVNWAVDSIDEEFRARMDAARAGNWTLELGPMETFREADLAEIVARDSQKSLSYGDLQAAISRELASEIDRLRSGSYVLDSARPEVRTIAQWLCALEPANPEFAIQLGVARLALARDLAQSRQYEEALKQFGLTTLHAELEPQHPDFVAAELDVATWIGEHGDVETARELCRNVVEPSRRTGEPSQPTGLVARQWLAHYTGLCGDAAEALALYLAVIDEAREQDAAIRLKASSGAALWTGELGRFDEAVAELERLIPLCSQRFGHDHHETLECRRLRARFTGEGGDADGARLQYEELVSDVTAWLGPTHFEALESRRGLARWTLEARDPEGAVSMYREVAVDCESIYGPKHYLTLWAWIGLSVALGTAGEYLEAYHWAHQANRVACQVWSPSHRLVTISTARTSQWACAIALTRGPGSTTSYDLPPVGEPGSL